MNDHYLDAVRRLAPVAPVPSAAVLAAAMATAGLHPTGSPVACPEPATDPTTDPLLLQPRHPRRTRRRMVSLTVALATTGVAAAVVGALLVVSGGAAHVSSTAPLGQPGGGTVTAAEPSGLTFPTDAQLAAAQWFHVTTDQGPEDPTCRGNRDVWFPRSGDGGIIRQSGEGKTPCGLTDTPIDARDDFFLNDLKGNSQSFSRLQGWAISEADLSALIKQASASTGPNPTQEYDTVIADSLRETPLPSTLRHELRDLLSKAPGVATVVGHDSLGRPVVWLTRDFGKEYGRSWWGFDAIQDWMIAEANGPAGADGGPARPSTEVLGIDTTSPTPLSRASRPAVVERDSSAPSGTPANTASPALTMPVR